MARIKGVKGFHSSPFFFKKFRISDSDKTNGKSEGAGIYVSTSKYTNSWYHSSNTSESKSSYLKKHNILSRVPLNIDKPFSKIIKKFVSDSTLYKIFSDFGPFVSFKSLIVDNFKSLFVSVHDLDENDNLIEKNFIHGVWRNLDFYFNHNKKFPLGTIDFITSRKFKENFVEQVLKSGFETSKEELKSLYDKALRFIWNLNFKDDFWVYFYDSPCFKSFLKVAKDISSSIPNTTSNYMVTILVEDGLNDHVIGFQDTYTIDTVPPKVAAFCKKHPNQFSAFNFGAKILGKDILRLICKAYGTVPWEVSGLKHLIRLGLRATRSYASQDFCGVIASDETTDEDVEEFEEDEDNKERGAVQYYYIVYHPKFLIIEGVSRGKRTAFNPQSVGEYNNILKRFDPDAFEEEYSEMNPWKEGESYADYAFRKFDKENIKKRNKERATKLLKQKELSPDDEALALGYLRVDDSVFASMVHQLLTD